MVQSISLDGNTVTSSPEQALYVRSVPGNSTYSITNNDLRNAATWALNFEKGDDPGVTLTLTGNTFDGSRNGARLNNILGPFTLSPADNNTFVGAGWTGGTPLQISGKDVTVDGWTTLGLVGGTVGIHVVQRTLNPFNTHRPSETVTISNNTITGPRWGVLMDMVQSISLDGNTVTSSPEQALYVRSVPGNSTYSITNNDLRNAATWALNFEKGDDPGVTLTLTGSNFDGSRNGARLNNILGPFTLSPADNNTFVGAGWTGGTPLQISGKDVTVDGWTTLGVVGGVVGIHVVQRTLNPFNTHRASEAITISNNTIAGTRWGVLMDMVQSISLDGNTVTSSPEQALYVRSVPGNSTYSITNNDLRNAATWALNFEKGDDPGVTLTLTGNNLDGSRNGARLNNILGPFTLSPADNNTFDGAGWTGGTPLQISGKDVTVDGWTTLGVVGGIVGIHVVQRTLNPFNTHRASEAITISNNTVTGPTYGVLTDGVKSITVDGNTITNSPGNAVYIRGVPGSSTYSINDNDLSNAVDTSLLIGKVQNPGLTLTLTGNTFDGSRSGASLNNILGPFTLSTTNTFAGAGLTGGTTLSMSGVDLTVDGFAFGFATLEGGVGINVFDRALFGHAVSNPSQRITISNTSVTGFVVGTQASLNNRTLDNDVTFDNVTACGNTQGIGIRSRGAQVLGGNVGGNNEGVHVFGESTNVVIDGVNFFGNTADVVDNTGGAGVTVQNSTSNSFNCGPTLSIDDVDVLELSGSALLTVTLDPASASDVSVDFVTSDGTAAAPDDYTATSGTATIPAGSLTATIIVPVIDDAVTEPDETFTVTLSNPVGAGISSTAGSSTVTILDDETLIAIPGLTDWGLMAMAAVLAALGLWRRRPSLAFRRALR